MSKLRAMIVPRGEFWLALRVIASLTSLSSWVRGKKNLVVEIVTPFLAMPLKPPRCPPIGQGCGQGQGIYLPSHDS